MVDTYNSGRGRGGRRSVVQGQLWFCSILTKNTTTKTHNEENNFYDVIVYYHSNERFSTL